MLAMLYFPLSSVEEPLLVPLIEMFAKGSGSSLYSLSRIVPYTVPVCEKANIEKRENSNNNFNFICCICCVIIFRCKGKADRLGKC